MLRGPNTRRSFVENLTAMKPMQSKSSIVKLVLDSSMRSDALRELARMNVTAASLFPGLDGFGRSLQTSLFDRVERVDVRRLSDEAPWSESDPPKANPSDLVRRLRTPPPGAPDPA